jgi:hypothetical protein
VFARNHFVTPILYPRTIEPIVRDGDCGVAVVVSVGAKNLSPLRHFVLTADASPLQRITMIPCTWFGITMNASNSTNGKWSGVSSQQRRAILPASFKCISPFSTCQNRHARCCVHTVTKYAPAGNGWGTARRARTGGGWNGDGACLDRTALSVSCGGRDESRPYLPS